MLGGGLLGLEAAKAVHDLPTVAAVSIVHRQSYPLSRQLDAQGGDIVRARIEAIDGVRFLGGASIARLLTEGSGAGAALTGVELTDGTSVPCTMLVCAIGIRPRDDLARSAGLECAVAPRASLGSAERRHR